VKHAESRDLLSLHLVPEDGGDMLLRNAGLFSSDYTALYPKRELFIITAERTSNPT
jgi:hypothetical protein